MRKKRKKIIRYIEFYINDCLIDDRRVILNIIAQKIGCRHLYEENTGIRILYEHINISLLTYIKEHIVNSIKETELILSD